MSADFEPLTEYLGPCTCDTNPDAPCPQEGWMFMGQDGGECHYKHADTKQILRLPNRRSERVWRTRRIEAVTWHARPDICPPGISVYVDVNTQGLYFGGSLWRVEGYFNLNWRGRS